MTSVIQGGWTCPECGRLFGRVRQSHECAPAMELEEYLATGPDFERSIFDAVMTRVDAIGPVVIEPVSVGLFIKHTNGVRFVELRPMTKWMALSFLLPRRLDHPRVSRKPMQAGQQWFHVVNLHTADDVDDLIAGWLAESYLTT